MDKNLELIWKKIDNTLSGDEIKVFNSRMEDPSFVEEYKKQLKLHNLLHHIPDYKAPDGLLQGVMSQLTFKRIYNLNFPGIKYLGWGLLATALALSLVVYFANGTQLNSSESNFINYIPDFLFNRGLASGLLPYSMALLALAGLLMLDNILKNKNHKLKRMV